MGFLQTAAFHQQCFLPASQRGCGSGGQFDGRFRCGRRHGLFPRSGQPGHLAEISTTFRFGWKKLYLPVSDWVLNRNSLSHPTAEFISPDGTTVLPVGESFLTGETSWGIKSSPQIRSFGFGEAVPGKPFYITDESNLRTWKAGRRMRMEA